MKKSYAIIAVDMQNDFIEKGAVRECEGGREIIPYIKKLLDVARRKGNPVINVKKMHRPDGSDFFEVGHEKLDHCVEGTRGAEIVEGLTPQEGDYIVIKRRFSAFFGSDLEVLLKTLGINTLVITGVATNICVRGTIQDAYQIGYHVIVPKECVAATTRDLNEPNLRDINKFYGKVLPLEEVIKIIKKSRD